MLLTDRFTTLPDEVRQPDTVIGIANQPKAGQGTKPTGKQVHFCEVPHSILRKGPGPATNNSKGRLGQMAQILGELHVGQGQQFFVRPTQQARCVISAEECAQKHSSRRRSMWKFLLDEGTGEQLWLVYERAVGRGYKKAKSARDLYRLRICRQKGQGND